MWFSYNFQLEDIVWENQPDGAYQPRGGWAPGLKCGPATCIGDTEITDLDECLCGEDGSFDKNNLYCISGNVTGNSWNKSDWITGDNENRHHAYWIKSGECMSGGCVKMYQNGQGDIGVGQKLEKSMIDLGWDVGTIIYVSWWQKTVPDAGDITRSSHVGIYGQGASPWVGSNNSSTGYYGNRDSSRSNAYKNSKSGIWEKSWDMIPNPNLDPYGN